MFDGIASGGGDMNGKIGYGLIDQKYVAGIVVLFFGALLATYGLFFNMTLPVCHDILFHLFQSDQFDRALKSGAIIPRWVLSSNNGYGSPNFIFYAPLSYYTVAAVHSIVPSIITSMKIVIWLSFFLSGVTMFTALSKISGTPGTLLSAVLYQILPFHSADLYCRGTLAELMAYIWFPLIVMYAHEIFQSKGSTMAGIGLSVSYAGLIITHLVSGFIFTWVLTAYLFFNYLRLKDNYSGSRALISIVLGFGLSSFYLFPVIFEQQFVQLDYLFRYLSIGTYKDNFLFVPRIIHTGTQNFSLWLDFIVILEAMLFFALLARLWKNKNWQPCHSPQVFFLYLFPTVIVLMTPLAGPIWNLLPGFATLQFPWRWIAVLEVALCFLLNSACFEVGAWFTWGSFANRILVYLICTVFLLACSIVFTIQFYSQEILDGMTDPERAETYTDLPGREYTPVAATALDELLASGRGKKVSVLSGVAVQRVVEWQPERRRIAVQASVPTQLRVALFYYPGWEAMLDGRVIPIKTQTGSGAIVVDIPTGSHVLTLSFVDTPLRRISKYLSLFSFIVAIAAVSFHYMRRAAIISHQPQNREQYT